MELLRSYLSKRDIKKILKSKPGDDGFSLVELVVVIAVLAILAAVAIPSFQGVQSRAKTSALKNGLVNGVKECVVSDGLGNGTEFLASRSYQGDYNGYTVRKRRDTEDTCYMAEGIPVDSEAFPWFVIEYDVTNGRTTKICDGNKVGCSEGSW